MARPERSDARIHVTKHDLMQMLAEYDAMKGPLQTMLPQVLEAEMDGALAKDLLGRSPANQNPSLCRLSVLPMTPARFSTRCSSPTAKLFVPTIAAWPSASPAYLR